VDIELIEKKAKEPISHPWFQGNDQVILAVGRLTKQKDYPTLLRAFSIVCRKVSCKLVILGEGEKRKELGELVKELGLEGKVDMPVLSRTRLRTWQEPRCLSFLEVIPFFS